jgi:hypothetical protein
VKDEYTFPFLDLEDAHSEREREPALTGLVEAFPARDGQYVYLRGKSVQDLGREREYCRQTDGALDPDGTSDRLGCGRDVASTSLAFNHQGQIRQRRLHAGSIAPPPVERQIKSEHCLARNQP